MNLSIWYLWKRSIPFQFLCFHFHFFGFEKQIQEKIENPIFSISFYFLCENNLGNLEMAFLKTYVLLGKFPKNSLPDNFSINLSSLPFEEQNIGFWNDTKVHIPRIL